ncbi:hypothetical protein [Flavobacterium sp.]|uniref:hypothetical protein n=1 Tax=Flavobacterium sp. TaxID=239 RepID=UPI00375301C7
MKKIILLTFLFLSFTINAQKTVYIYNGSSKILYVGNLKTKSLTSPNTYLVTNNYNVINGILQPGQILILENTTSATRFPFLYTSSQISNLSVVNWQRTINNGATFSTVSNSAAYSANGASQIFDRASFRIGTGGSLGSFTLGVGLPTIVSGSTWTADYTTNTDPNFPNLQETVITINDL